MATDEPCAQDGATEPCYPGMPSTRGIGECSDGYRLCMGSFWSQCLQYVVPTEEVCGDDDDDDCDGRADEGCPCEAGSSRACYTGNSVTAGIGVCQDGQQRCDGSVWPDDCEGEITPSAELCNGEDDDCNGVLDDCGGDGCPDCAPAGHCESGSCIPYAFEWVVGSWGACSASCGGGSQTRTVQCVREDDVVVDDSLCPDPRPGTSQGCNSQPCCSTDSLVYGQRCDGDAQVQWVDFNTNTGSSADRAACAQACSNWASGQLNQWCCQLYEDSSAGTNWVCRVYDAYSMHASSGDRYSGLGRCQSP